MMMIDYHPNYFYFESILECSISFKYFFKGLCIYFVAHVVDDFPGINYLFFTFQELDFSCFLHSNFNCN